MVRSYTKENPDYVDYRTREPEHKGGFWSWLLGEEPTPTGEYGTYDTSLASGYTIVTVTVDEIHADAVVGIIDQHGPTDIHEHAAEQSGVGHDYASSAMTDRADHVAPGVTTSETAAGKKEEVIPLAEEELQVGKRTVDRGATTKLGTRSPGDLAAYDHYDAEEIEPGTPSSDSSDLCPLELVISRIQVTTMEHGGSRPGAGRPRGSEGAATKARRVAKREISAKVVTQFQIDHPDGFQGDSIDFLRCIYRNPDLDLLVRIDAAKSNHCASCFVDSTLQCNGSCIMDITCNSLAVWASSRATKGGEQVRAPSPSSCHSARFDAGIGDPSGN
jgi:hypothetical protein